MRLRNLPILVAALLSFSAVAQAATPNDFAGTWVMRLGSRNMFVLTLTQRGSTFDGVWDRPAKYETTNGAFSNIQPGFRQDRIVHATLSGDSLHLTIQNAGDPKDEDSFLMTLHGDHALLTYDDPDYVVAPYSFERAAPGAKIAVDWEPNRLYTANDSDTSNPEMKAIFDEDQRVRSTTKIDWPAVTKTDKDRREQTRKLLAAGALHTGSDYEEAAFVFQHGGSADDYLLAHTLALVAVSKGHATAIWIAAATLDRYLQIIGQKQIYGTQYSNNAERQWTQDPYDRDLVSDALRRQLAVPTQALQARQLKLLQSKK
jgi:hypothetical protein